MNSMTKTIFLRALIVLPFMIFSLAACDDHTHNGDHSHDHDHGDDHAPHGFIDDTLNRFKAIFNHDDHAHDQHNKHDHGHPHDDHDDHGAGAPVLVITDFTESTELFVEFPALVVAQESVFAAHLTRLSNFQPIASGVVTLTLSGGGVEDEVFSVATSHIPGIFQPAVTPQHAVIRQLSLHLKGEGLDVVHALGSHKVHSSSSVAMAKSTITEQPADVISYLKEQQWQVNFAVTPAVVALVRKSIPATGSIRPRADGEVHLSAVSAGHLRAREGFPFPGMQVEAGQVLADITPRLGMGDDLSTLKAAYDKARSEHQLAKQERQRLEKLIEVSAISKSRLLEAKSAEVVSKAELDTAMHRYQQSSSGKQSSFSIPILAPISGMLAQVNVAPGQYVHEGDALFHIVNLEQLWLEARIAEADIAALQQPDGAWFTLKGFEQSFNTFDMGGSMVALGGAIDPVSRTVPLIFEFTNPDQRLRSGMFATVQVYTGKAIRGVLVPHSAIFNDGGQEVVYVMLGGETFQRRIVRLGIRDGDMVQLLSGVEAGERVVSQGAYFVRLASAGITEVGHGHAH